MKKYIIGGAVLALAAAGTAAFVLIRKKTGAF